MGNSSSAVARSVGWLRFALVVLVCLVFGLVLGYSATPAVRWLGKRIAVAETSRSAVASSTSRRTEPDLSADSLSGLYSAGPPDEGHLSPTLRAGPNVQDSRSGRPVQADNLRALSSVRTGTHLGEDWKSKTHWDYCGNPQCRLCYPVAGSPLTSDTGLPDMPQGYYKRHPQSRDCKPIVVPAPKPLPKATDPPVVASAGLGEFSRETLAWALVCLFFVAWLVSGLELSRSKQSLRVADRLLRRREIEASEVRQIVQSWLDKQGHDRCWYYPEIFTELARVLDLRGVKPPQLPTLADFKAGCERYQREQYPTDAKSEPKCVKCGAQSEGLSEPCKLTPYGVHDLGPLPQRNLGTGCIEGCRHPTLHVPGCKHDEYDRLTVARERARLHLFRAEYELESFSGHLNRISATQLPSVNELKSQILAAIEKRPVSPSLCVVRGCTNESYDPASVGGLCWKHEHPESLKSLVKRMLAAGATPKIPEAVMRDIPVWSEAIKCKHLSVPRPLRVLAKGHIPEAARCDPGDLCSLHKPCAKHESKRISCGIVSVNNGIDVECTETALGYIRSGDAVCIKHAKDFQIDRLVEPFPPEYLGLSIERDRLSLRAQQQFQTLASATSSMSLRKAQAQPANSDERGTDNT